MVRKIKNELERKFNYLLTNNYINILLKLLDQLIIDSVIRDIINQVSLNHNP